MSRVWHPAPQGELIDIGNGRMAAVLVGEPAYQLTTGAIIQIGE